MKKLSKALSAVMSAAVIFGTAAMPVSAFDPPDEGTYIGWEYSSNGWHYTYVEYYEDDEEPSDPYCCAYDGVIYVFDRTTWCAKEKYSGRITWYDNETYRYFKDGLPYTGWTKYKSGKRKYFLDGFAVTGNFFIGGKLYGFDKNGFCTGEKALPAVVAEVGKVTADAEDIVLTVTANDPSGGEYSVGEPYKMERWEDGKWTDCQNRAVRFEAEESEYEVSDIALVLSGTAGSCEPNSAKRKFSPLKYYAGKRTDLILPEGYYRIAVPCRSLTSEQKESYDVYAVFEILPPLEVTVSEEVCIGGYDLYTKLSAEVKINSDKISPKDVDFDFYKKVTANDYKRLENTDGSLKRKTVSRKAKPSAASTGSYASETRTGSDITSAQNGDTYIKISGNYILDSGYYKASAVVGGNEYHAFFGAAVPKVYGKGDKNYYSIERDGFDFKLDLIIRNGLNKPIDINANSFTLYTENSKGEYERIIGYDIDLEPKKVTLAPKDSTKITVDIGARYNISELGAGHYLLTVNGLPYYFTVSEK